MRLRKAFTMIELIFVIVIIGILASIAIPKLNATRMNAKLSTKANNIMVAATEISAYAVSRNRTTTHLTDMSNSLQAMVNTSDAIVPNPSEPTINIKVEEVTDCIIMKIEDQGANTETLVIEYGATSSENCTILRSLIDKDQYPIALRGTRIIY